MIEEVRRDALDQLMGLRNGTLAVHGVQPLKYQLILDQIINEVKHMKLYKVAGPEEE